MALKLLGSGGNVRKALKSILERFFQVKKYFYLLSPYNQTVVLYSENCTRYENFYSLLDRKGKRPMGQGVGWEEERRAPRGSQQGPLPVGC